MWRRSIIACSILLVGALPADRANADTWSDIKKGVKKVVPKPYAPPVVQRNLPQIKPYVSNDPFPSGPPQLRLPEHVRRGEDLYYSVEARRQRFEADARDRISQLPTIDRYARRNFELPKYLSDRDFVRRTDDLRTKTDEFDRILREANNLQSDDRATRERAYRRLREKRVLRSDKGDVWRRLSDSADRVIPGGEIDHYDEAKLAEAVAESASSGSPEPALLYIKKLAIDTAAELRRGLRDEWEDVGGRIVEALPRLLMRAMDDALQGRGVRSIRVSGVKIEVGMARYSNWIEIVYDRPEWTNRGFEVRKMRKTINVPATFEAYVRISYGATVAPGGYRVSGAGWR